MHEDREAALTAEIARDTDTSQFWWRQLTQGMPLSALAILCGNAGATHRRERILIEQIANNTGRQAVWWLPLTVGLPLSALTLMAENSAVMAAREADRKGKAASKPD